jgi:predicted RNA-binding Zn-ribbon protein involved in translation (DUF1610 family)
VHSFKELKPDEIRAILDARNEKGEKLYEDVLTPLTSQEAALFQNSPCPKCGSAAAPMLNLQRPFASNSPLPNKILRCVVCGTEFDPRTQLIHFANITYASD